MNYNKLHISLGGYIGKGVKKRILRISSISIVRKQVVLNNLRQYENKCKFKESKRKEKGKKKGKKIISERVSYRLHYND